MSFGYVMNTMQWKDNGGPAILKLSVLKAKLKAQNLERQYKMKRTAETL